MTRTPILYALPLLFGCGVQDSGALLQAPAEAPLPTSPNSPLAPPSNTGCNGTGAPRLISPLSTSQVTTQRPRLRFIRGDGGDWSSVQICADRACDDVLQTLNGKDTVMPEEDLPSGIVYWRAQTLARCSEGAYSPTWQFTVPSRSAPLDNSFGVAPDFNGDGLGDIASGVPGFFSEDTPGSVVIYTGQRDRALDQAEPTRLEAPSAERGFGGAVAIAGDINGDGFGDLAVGARSNTINPDPVYLYYGTPQGLHPTPQRIMQPDDSGPVHFGSSLAGAGDVNQDGYGDLIVGAPGIRTSPGKAYVYYGGPEGLQTTFYALLEPSVPQYSFGEAVAGVGDTDGNGLADVAVSAPNDEAGHVYLYPAWSRGLYERLELPLGPGRTARIGESISSAGDVNADGYADMVIGGPGVVAGAWLYLGCARDSEALCSSSWIPKDPSSGEVGLSVSQAGDINGDGYDDLLIGATAQVLVAFGGPESTILQSPPGSITVGRQGMQQYGSAVAFASDTDGDGFSDIVVGDPGIQSGQTLGQVWVQFGHTTRPTSSRLRLTDARSFGTALAN